jgi:hypothetical protein
LSDLMCCGGPCSTNRSVKSLDCQAHSVRGQAKSYQ